jgi:hypothetical protein
VAADLLLLGVLIIVSAAFVVIVLSVAHRLARALIRGRRERRMKKWWLERRL